FGAAATWNSSVDVGNRVVEDHWYKTRDCGSEGYGFNFNLFNGFGEFLLTLFKFSPAIVPVRIETASCNALGLFPLGKILIEKLMQKGMLIDVDHMSARAFDETLAMAEASNPKYPVVAGHVLAFDLHDQAIRHERMLTRAQLERIRGVDGMIAAMLKDDVQDTDKKGQKHNVAYGSIADDCRHSSKTFAQAYEYAVDVMRGPVAFGSDFNRIAWQYGLAFGR